MLHPKGNIYQGTDLAAALTYYAVLALFPALLALVSLLGLVGQQGKSEELITVLPGMGAGSVADTPNVQQPKFRWISIGAAVAIVTWVVASGLFGLYVPQFADYNKTYGSLAGVIISCCDHEPRAAVGAELDAEMERGR